MYKAEHYTYQVAYSEDDEAFVARVLDFPGLAADGNTLEQALAEIHAVVRAVLEDMYQNKEEPPVPLTCEKYNGKIMLRVPSDTHRKLVSAAKNNGLSLNAFIARWATGVTG